MSLGSPSKTPNWQGQSSVCDIQRWPCAFFAQLLSSLLQGSHTAPGSRRCVGGGKKQDLNFCLPSSSLPGSTRVVAEPGKGPAASGFASAWATHRVGRGGGGSLASLHLLCRFFSSTSCSLSAGRGGERAPRAGQSCTDVKKEVFWLPFLSGGTGTGMSAASVTAEALVMVDGHWLCCRVGRGTAPALTWAPWWCCCSVFPRKRKRALC